MSAADSLARLGGGAKDLAIGAGVLVGIGVIVYLIVKSRDVAEAIGDTVTDAGGYLFGGEYAESTIGTDLYDWLNPEPAPRADGKPAYYDPAQAEKTRIAIIGARPKNYGVD